MRKTRKSAHKRFKITKTGKILFSHQYQGHLMRKKSNRRIRAQKEPGHLGGRFAKKMKQIMGKA